MERVRKDYEQMRRVLEGQEPASASVAIVRAAGACPTDDVRVAGGWCLAALVAAAAATPGCTLPSTLRLFAVKADGLYPAALELESLAAVAAAALSRSGAAVHPLKGIYGGGDRSVRAGVECRSGGKVGFQVSWHEGGQEYTVQLEAALSRIALAGPARQLDGVGVVSLSVQLQPGRKGVLDVAVQLAAPLPGPGSGARAPVVFSGFGLTGWEQRKTKRISSDRRTLTFEAPASQRQQLEGLAAALAAKTKKATVAVTVAGGTGGESGSSARGADASSGAGRAAALLFEVQPQAAVVTEPAHLGDVAAAAAVKRSLWAKLGAHGQLLAPRLLAANHAPSSVEGRLQWLEAQTEAATEELAVMAHDREAQLSALTSAILEHDASIDKLAQRVSWLEASSSAAQQPSGTAGAAQEGDADMAEADSRKRSRQSTADDCRTEGAAIHAVALAVPEHQQPPQPQPQPRPSQQNPVAAAAILTGCSAVAVLKEADTRLRIAEAAAWQHSSCTHEQLVQASGFAAGGLYQPAAGPAGGALALPPGGAGGVAASQPSGQSSMAALGSAAQVPAAPAIGGADAAAQEGAATISMQQGVPAATQQAAPVGNATAAAVPPAAGSSSGGMLAAQPAHPAGLPPGRVPQLQPTSVLQLQPQQLSSLVFRVLREQWQQGRPAVPARHLASLVCMASQQAMPTLMLLEDPGMPAQQKSAIVRHITTLLYHLSRQPGSWVCRYQQGEAVYYGLAASWATGAAAVAMAAAAGASTGS